MKRTDFAFRTLFFLSLSLGPGSAALGQDKDIQAYIYHVASSDDPKQKQLDNDLRVKTWNTLHGFLSATIKRPSPGFEPENYEKTRAKISEEIKETIKKGARQTYALQHSAWYFKVNSKFDLETFNLLVGPEFSKQHGVAYTIGERPHRRTVYFSLGTDIMLGWIRKETTEEEAKKVFDFMKEHGAFKEKVPVALTSGEGEVLLCRPETMLWQMFKDLGDKNWNSLCKYWDTTKDVHWTGLKKIASELAFNPFDSSKKAPYPTMKGINDAWENFKDDYKNRFLEDKRRWVEGLSERNSVGYLAKMLDPELKYYDAKCPE